VCLPKNGDLTPEEYMKRIDRFGVSKETTLGRMFIPINKMNRIISMKSKTILSINDNIRKQLMGE